MGEYLGILINESAPVAVRREFCAEEASPDFVATVRKTFPVELGAGSVTVFHAAKPVLPAAETPMILTFASRPDFWQQVSSFTKRHKPEMALGGLGATVLACSWPVWAPLDIIIPGLIIAGGFIGVGHWLGTRFGWADPEPKKKLKKPEIEHSNTRKNL